MPGISRAAHQVRCRHSTRYGGFDQVKQNVKLRGLHVGNLRRIPGMIAIKAFFVGRQHLDHIITDQFIDVFIDIHKCIARHQAQIDHCFRNSWQYIFSVPAFDDGRRDGCTCVGVRYWCGSKTFSHGFAKQPAVCQLHLLCEGQFIC